MKDIEDRLAKMLMEYGVLKNADADRLAKRIVGMFENERDQLAEKLKQVEVDSTFVAEQAVSDTDDEWLNAIGGAHVRMFGKPWETRDGETREEGLSSNVGALFQIIEDARNENAQLAAKCAEMREALERMAGYAATVRLDRRKLIDGCVMCLQMEDWCNGLLERVEESKRTLDKTK